MNDEHTATRQFGVFRTRGERGFALPFTIFLVTIITIMLAASFTRAASEHVVASSSDASLTALAVAESGLQAFFGDTFSVRPAATDSFRYNTVGGYAWVSPEVMVSPGDTTEMFMYVVRSVGYVIHPNQGSDPVAQRTIAQFARWQTGSMDVIGALVTPNGVNSRPGTPPGTVIVRGNDVTTCPNGIAPSVWSFRAPTPDSIGGVVIDTISATKTAWSQGGWPQPLALGTGVDWNQILTGGFTPDYTSIQYGDTSYPTQLIVGDATVENGVGYGLLMVTGNLEFEGGFAQWNGVILVGGNVTFDSGNTYVFGTIISGLNEQFGSSPPPTVLGGGPAVYLRYASCRVEEALKALTGFVPLENARVDNWATY